MRKIISMIIVSLTIINMVLVSNAEYQDLLYVKYPFTPVLSGSNSDSDLVAVVNKGYVILDKGEEGDYVKVLLTDDKEGYILKNNIANYDNNENIINGNFGTTINNSFLYKIPRINGKKFGLLVKGVSFKTAHVNYINDNWLKIEVLDGKFKGQVGYIKKESVNLNNLSGYRNDILSFIEKYSKKDNINNYNEEEIELNSAPEKEDMLDLINGLNNVISEGDNSSSGLPNNLNNNTSNDDTLDLIESLNNIISGSDNIENTPSSGSNSSPNNNTSNDNTLDLIESLNNIISGDDNTENNSSSGSTSNSNNNTSNDGTLDLIESLNNILK